MARAKQYDTEQIDRKIQEQDDWYLQRRREISDDESYVQPASSTTGKQSLIARKGEGEKNNFPPMHTLGDFPGMILSFVQRAAWDIVQGDADVRNTIISIQNIRGTSPETELAEFFRPGGLALPILGFRKMPNAASTPIDLSEELRKNIDLGMPYKNPENFTGAVVHYLHEINHYIDQWYSSDAANDAQYQGKWGANYADDSKHPGFVPGERSSGINQNLVLSNNRPALTLDEQQSALSELLNDANADMIDGLIKEEKIGDEDTGREKKLKEDYAKWLEKHKHVDAGKLQVMKLEYIDRIRQKLARDAKGTYRRWGTSINPDQTVSATKIEMGYVFEKQAYGFHTPGDTTGAWLTDFNKKFEAKFSAYLDPYKALLTLPVFKKSESISQPGDAHELQADSIAKKVVSGEQVSPGSITPVSSSLQPKTEGDGLHASSELSDQLGASKGRGNPLTGGVKTEMESGLGTNLSDVRIHTDSNAHSMSEGINAKAFTHGQDVYFKNGNYDTNSSAGKELLAHELVHTQQQGRGVNRKIQRVVSDADITTIDDTLTQRLFRIRELKRNTVLRILSQYTSDEIKTAWGDKRINGHLIQFIDSFHRVPDFDQFTMALVATFLAVDAETRADKIKALVNDRIVTSDEAVRILYLMQQLNGDQLTKAFDLEKDKFTPSKYDLFKMALPPAEAERIQLAYTHGLWVEQSKTNGKFVTVSDEVEKTAEKVRVHLGIDKQITGEKGKKEEKDYKKRARQVKKKTVEPLKAILAYKEIQNLYNISPDMEEEFGFRHPDLYAKVMENLPIQFMTSTEFGMQTVHFGPDTAKENGAYHFLYGFAKPYRHLYNHPEAFAHVLKLQGDLKADNRELEKDYLFEPREDKITGVRDSNAMLLQTATAELKKADETFVPPAEKAGFEAGIDAILVQTATPETPMLKNESWINLPGGGYNFPYLLAVLSGLFDDQLKKEQAAAQSPQKEQYTEALEFRRNQPDIDEVLIASPTSGDTKSVAEELQNDKGGLLDVYNQQRGIFDVIHNPDNWQGTQKANDNLAVALTLVVQSGLGEELWHYIIGKKVRMVEGETKENESILNAFGFTDEKYVPKGKKWEEETLTAPHVEAGKMIVNMIDEQLALLYPKQKNRIHTWSPARKALMFALRPVKSFRMLQAAAYFGEGFMLPNLNRNLVKRAHYENLDLVTVQEGMGGQIYGMEFGSKDPEKNKSLLNVDVNERKGTADLTSSLLTIKSMNMEYPDMLFKTGPGEFNTLWAHIVWPTDPSSDKGSTLMFLDSLDLSQMRYQDKESAFTMGKLHIDQLIVYSDKPIANYTQMNNWYKLFFSVMQFIQDILTLIMSGIQVSAQRFAPDMVKALTEPGADPRLQNPEKTLSDFLMQRLSEDQTIQIKYKGLKIEHMFFSDMGMIESFETGPASMTSTNYAIGNGEREMSFGFHGKDLQINGAAIPNTMEANQTGAEEFGLDMVFSEPSGGKVNGRDKASAQNFSQLATGKKEEKEADTKLIQVSKLKRMSFSLVGMTGDALKMIGLEMDTLPFSGVKGSVEFIDAIDGVDPKPPMVKLTLDSVTDVNFLGLPLPADMSLRLITNQNSKLKGNIENATIMLTLNDEVDQVERGWKIQKLNIVTMTIPELTGSDFGIVTQGSETTIEKVNKINQIVLTDFFMIPDSKDKDEWDITGLKLKTGGMDMQGVGIKTAAGVTANLQEFSAGTLNFTMAVTTGTTVDGKETENTKYTYDATGVNASGKIEYETPDDRYDASKPKIKVGTDINMENNTIGGTYTTDKVDGKTTGSSMTLTTTIDLISIPSLNVKSDKMQVTAPEVTDFPILLKTVQANVAVTFNEFGDATDFTINHLIIDKTTTHGLLITNLINKRNLVDLPENVESEISGFYIDNFIMKKRVFEQYEIDEMKRDKERKQLPDENQTWDFNTNPLEKGRNEIGLQSSTLPGGLKLAIGDHIGVQMKEATSGKIFFNFVTTKDFSYSITELDAEDVTITDDGKQIFKGDLDSRKATGSYKMEVIGKGLEAKKKTTITGQIDIPEIKIHQLNIASDTSLIEIPADATETSTITKLVADYSVVITGPSENEKAVIKAEAKTASDELNSGKKMSDKRRRDLTTISKKEAKSDVVMTINKMTVEKMQAYGLHLKSSSETEVKKSKSPAGRNIETYDSQAYELKLRKDTAATINSLYLEDFVVTLPADDEKKVVMSATTATAGGKLDVEGNAIPGIDIGTADVFTNSVMHLLQGTNETTPNKTNTSVTTRLEVKKLTFGGSTDGEYTVTIDDPKFWFPENKTDSKAPDVKSNTEEYDLDKKNPDGTPLLKHKSHVNVLLDSLQNHETPVLSSDSVVIKRQKVMWPNSEIPKLGANGEYLYKTTIHVVNPVLAMIDVKYVIDNAKAGEVSEIDLKIGGKLDGTLEIREEDKVNFADNDAAKKEEHKALVVEAINGGKLTFTEGTTIVMNYLPKPLVVPTAMTNAQWTAADADPATIDSELEVVAAYNEERNRDTDPNKAGDQVRDREFDFMDGIVSGSVVVSLFGTPVTVPARTFTDANGNVEGGFINIRFALETIGTNLGAEGRFNDPEVRRIVANMSAVDTGNNYWLEVYLNGNNQLILVPDSANNLRTDDEGNEFVRLSALLDYQLHKPPSLQPEPGSWDEEDAEQVDTETRAWFNGNMDLTITLSEVMIDFSKLNKDHRGILDFVADKGAATFSGTFGFNDTAYARTPEEIAAGIWKETSQGPTGTISSLSLPRLRKTIENKDTKSNETVISASSLTATTISFEYENFKREKLTLKPTKLDITGFRLDIKK